MKNGKKKATKTKLRNKRVTAVKQGKPTAKAATGVRAKAARRTAEGKFTKAVFAHVGGTECPRFAALTWKERDAYMAKPENSIVRERYKAHMASVGK